MSEDKSALQMPAPAVNPVVAVETEEDFDAWLAKSNDILLRKLTFSRASNCLAGESCIAASLTPLPSFPRTSCHSY